MLLLSENLKHPRKLSQQTSPACPKVHPAWLFI